MSRAHKRAKAPSGSSGVRVSARAAYVAFDRLLLQLAHLESLADEVVAEGEQFLLPRRAVGLPFAVVWRGRLDEEVGQPVGVGGVARTDQCDRVGHEAGLVLRAAARLVWLTQVAGTDGTLRRPAVKALGLGADAEALAGRGLLLLGLPLGLLLAPLEALQRLLLILRFSLDQLVQRSG